MNGTTITIGPAALRDLIADQVILNQRYAASGSLFHATRIARGVVEALGERQHLASRPDERPVTIATSDLHDHIIRQVTRYEPHVLLRASRFQAENIARNVLAALRAKPDASIMSNATTNAEPLEVALDEAIRKFAPSLADDVRREIASESVRKAITSVTAELRHAYTHLAAGRVVDQKSLAEGLLGPQIRRLERLYSGVPGSGTGSTPQGEGDADLRDLVHPEDFLEDDAHEDVSEGTYDVSVTMTFTVKLQANSTADAERKAVGCLDIDRIALDHARGTGIGGPIITAAAVKTDHRALAGELHREWTEAGSPGLDVASMWQAYGTAISVQRFAKGRDLWPSNGSDAHSLFNALIDHCG